MLVRVLIESLLHGGICTLSNSAMLQTYPLIVSAWILSPSCKSPNSLMAWTFVTSTAVTERKTIKFMLVSVNGQKQNYDLLTRWKVSWSQNFQSHHDCFFLYHSCGIVFLFFAWRCSSPGGMYHGLVHHGILYTFGIIPVPQDQSK